VASGDEAIIEALTALIDEVRSAARFQEGGGAIGGGSYWTIDDEREQRRLHVRCLAALDRFTQPNSAYRRHVEDMKDPSWVTDLADVLAALRDDYREGAMRPVTELVNAALFDDFLEMATELADKGFHGPAAVLAGSVLEEHVRKLAEKSEIAIRDDRDRPKSVELLGTELVKQGVISEPRRKLLAGWYGQRTEGAHGRFENVVPEEVPRMIEGIRDFIASNPA
jgi:hypothetical protein